MKKVSKWPLRLHVFLLDKHIMMSAHPDSMSQNPLPTRWSLLSRLKNWQDDQSWQEFFDAYWQLIYSVALQAGLTQPEAQDAVQETLLAAAKNIGQVKRDPARGPFKAWLLNTARWKIVDQFRKRPPAAAGGRGGGTDTATAECVPSASSFDLEVAWELEWKERMLAAALDQVKRKISPVEVQVFDLCVTRGVPVKEVATRLKLKLWKVYFAQKRVANLLKREVERLEGGPV